MALYKYQMSSWPVTFYPMPLIWTAYVIKMAATPIYGKTKYVLL